MTNPTPAQLSAAIKEARAELTAISGWINYNNQISDAQMQTFMTKVLTAALNAPVAAQIIPIKPTPTPVKGK